MTLAPTPTRRPPHDVRLAIVIAVITWFAITGWLARTPLGVSNAAGVISGMVAFLLVAIVTLIAYRR